jgi:polyferredoxin
MPPASDPNVNLKGPGPTRKKPLRRRLTLDYSQQTRRVVQVVFLLLNLWIAVEFLLWVRSFGESASTVNRPAGVDGWLPIAGLMNLKILLATRHMPSIHPAAMVLAACFLGLSILMKKTFCSWLCPVGTVSEYLWKLGRRMFGRNFNLPRWADLPLRSLKYILMAFFLYLVVSMPAAALNEFMVTPFGIIADVKMLNFFRELGLVGAIVIGSLLVLSVFVQNFWCRFLCPYGALMGLVSALSPVRIRRDVQACIDCGKCNKACPAQLPVDRLVQIRSLECTSCMECVAVCPAQDALQFALPPRRETMAARWKQRVLEPRMVAAVLAIFFFGLVGAAKLTGHWQTNISREMYQVLVPNADQYGHEEQVP